MAGREHIRHPQARQQCVNALNKLPGRMNRPEASPTYDPQINLAHRDANIDALYDRAWEILEGASNVTQRDWYYAAAITMVYENCREMAGE